VCVLLHCLVAQYSHPHVKEVVVGVHRVEEEYPIYKVNRTMFNTGRRARTLSSFYGKQERGGKGKITWEKSENFEFILWKAREREEGENFLEEK
jgi:hypothetical protein